MNLSGRQNDQGFMGVVRALVALTITLVALGAGFLIGKRWIPPYETEVVDGLIVEKLCRAWTDGCDLYARDDRKDVYRSASACKTERVYKCVSYGW